MACAGWQAGFPCVGLTGVECWSIRRPRDKDNGPKGPRQLLPDLAAIPLEGRVVYLVFDSDATDKPEVQHAECALAEALQRQGALVKVVRLPAGVGADGAAVKAGLDDFLLAEGPEALRQLLETAVPPAPPEAPAGQEHQDDGRPVVLLGTDEHRVVRFSGFLRMTETTSMSC